MHTWFESTQGRRNRRVQGASPMSPGKTTEWEEFAADWEQLAKELFPEPDPKVVGSAGAHTPTGREVAIHSRDQEPLQSGKLPSIAKRIALVTLYVMIVASVPIAGFSIVHGGHDAEPVVIPIPPEVSGGTEVVAI